MDTDDFGNVVKEKRKQFKVSQKTLSKLTGVGQSQISGLERGNYNIGFDKILKIRKALKIKCYVPHQKIDDIIIEQLLTLGREDKINLLRAILRMKNTPQESSDILQEILKEVLFE